MLIPSLLLDVQASLPSLSRRVNANSQHEYNALLNGDKLIKKGEC